LQLGRLAQLLLQSPNPCVKIRFPKRDDQKAAAKEKKQKARTSIPDDGEWLTTRPKAKRKAPAKRTKNTAGSKKTTAKKKRATKRSGERRGASKKKAAASRKAASNSGSVATAQNGVIDLYSADDDDDDDGMESEGEGSTVQGPAKRQRSDDEKLWEDVDNSESEFEWEG